MDPHLLKLRSALSPEECTKRILSAIDAESSGFSFQAARASTKPVVGFIKGSSLQLRKRIDYRNSFQTFLSAELRPDGTGTVIVGKFAMHPFVFGFMGCWFVGVVLIGIVGAISVLASFHPGSTLHRSGGWWMSLVIPPAMLIFGACLVKFGRYVAHGETRFLIDFLVELIEPVSPASPPEPPRSDPAAGS